MKNVGIVTIIDNDNYGNRLQNYAVQEFLRENGVNPKTLINKNATNSKKNYIIRAIKTQLNILLGRSSTSFEDRKNKFKEFNNNIEFAKKELTAYSKISNQYDFFVVGSDQVWNPNFGRLRDVDLLTFARNEQKISFSSSFGINEIPQKLRKYVSDQLSSFKAISVREDIGKNIIEDLTERKDVEVLVDPTMLISSDKWDKLQKRPKQLDQLKKKKYILNYFLGEIEKEWKEEIDRIARENNCEVINLLDKKSPFYLTGPSEFLYLEKNAFLVCTDSFHSSVFSIIYNRPFIVFNRTGKDEKKKMSSRIDTLLSKFNLQERRFEGKITEENLKHDYTETYKILENEKQKSMTFLKKALDIK